MDVQKELHISAAVGLKGASLRCFLSSRLPLGEHDRIYARLRGFLRFSILFLRQYHHPLVDGAFPPLPGTDCVPQSDDYAIVTCSMDVESFRAAQARRYSIKQPNEQHWLVYGGNSPRIHLQQTKDIIWPTRNYPREY